MKKNIIIGILVVIIIGLCGAIAYVTLNDNDSKETSKDNNQNGAQIGEDDTDTSTEEREYIHFTSTELKFDKDGEQGTGISVAVKDGKLVETSKEGLTFVGIEGDAKYFTYDIGCDGTIGFLVLTEDEKLYVGYDEFMTHGNIQFQQLKTNEKVKDVTEYLEPSLGTCDGIYLGVVLENGKIYGVEGFYNGKDVYTLGTVDYSQYKEKLGQIILYSDNSLSTNGERREKFLYNDKPIIAKKIYSLDGLIVNESYSEFYILDKSDMLYYVKLDVSDWQNGIYIVKISLVKDSKVTSVDESEKSITVHFADGTTEKYDAGPWGDEEKIYIYDIS